MTMDKVKFEVEHDFPTPGGNLTSGLSIIVDGRTIGRVFMGLADGAVVKAHLDRVAKLEEMLDWARQTVHRAYHHTTETHTFGALDRETPMESCKKDICVSIRRLLGMEE
jgi:hypothetical protein